MRPAPVAGMPGTSAVDAARPSTPRPAGPAVSCAGPAARTPAGAASSSGRASTSTNIGGPRRVEQVVQEVQQPGVGVLGVLEPADHRLSPAARRSKNSRHAANSSSRATPPRRPDRGAEQRGQPRPQPVALAAGRARTGPGRRPAARRPRRRILLGEPSRCRTILGQRPERHPLAVGQAPAPVPPHLAASPSAYFSNSQPSRDLPTPARRDTHQPRATRTPAVAWNSSLSGRSSASRPVSGASSPSTRCHPPTSASTAARPPQPHRLGLALQRDARRRRRTRSRRPPAAASPRRPSTVPGSAAACTRAAVFTASPATMPSPAAPSVTATSPVTTPARAASPARPDLLRPARRPRPPAPARPAPPAPRRPRARPACPTPPSPRPR